MQQLLQIAESEFHIIPKLDLSIIVEPDINQWERNSGWQGGIDKLHQKRLDFVMFDKQWTLFCVIGLVNYDKGLLLDVETKSILESVSIPLLVLERNKQYTIEQLVEKITNLCS
ncbi:hypothetical protein THIOSC13_1800020 [uncultured Thiomicrorhabdus sp.]